MVAEPFAREQQPAVHSWQAVFQIIHMDSTSVGLALVHLSSEVEPVAYEAVAGGGALHSPLNGKNS